MGRILYISQYVVTPDQPGGVRHWRHVRALADAGHDVTVITSKVLHTTREAPEEFAGRRTVRRTEDGIEVLRAYSSTGYGNDARSRAANHSSFSAYAFPAAMRTARPDVVLGSSPPLTVGVLGGLVSQLRRTRFILEVRDLWPESALATGLLTNPKAIAVMDRMARYCYSRADRVIALTEGIRDGVIAAGVPERAVTLITNGIDPPDADDRSRRGRAAGRARRVRRDVRRPARDLQLPVHRAGRGGAPGRRRPHPHRARRRRRPQAGSDRPCGRTRTGQRELFRADSKARRAVMARPCRRVPAHVPGCAAVRGRDAE